MRIKLFVVITKFQYCWLLKYVISSSLFWWENKVLDLFLFPRRFWYQFSYWGNVHQFSWSLLWTSTWNWLLKYGNNYEIPVAKILTRTAVVDFIDALHVDLPGRQDILNFYGSSRVSMELSLTWWMNLEDWALEWLMHKDNCAERSKKRWTITNSSKYINNVSFRTLVLDLQTDEISV
jgi:hypothetical protein